MYFDSLKVAGGEKMKNIGVDIVKNSRFEEMINDEKKYSRILSDREVQVFIDITAKKRKIEYLASRFAAKEAIIKAINKTNLSFNYRDISVLNDANGAPYVEFSFSVNFYILISISHTDEDSLAFAVMI